MNLYINILKLLLNKDIYIKYYKYIDLSYLKNNYPELYKLFLVYPKLFDIFKGENASIVDLQAVFEQGYPLADKDLFGSLMGKIEAANADGAVICEYLSSLEARQMASNLAFVALDFAEGKATQEKLDEAVKGLGTKKTPEIGEQKFVSDDLEELYDSAVAQPGLSWRLKSLRRSIGPLRKGDFGFIFARPETGKTTFLASEVTHMAGHSLGPILWINNEEQGEKVALRCYTAALGAPLERILADKRRAKEAFHKVTKRNIKIRDDSGVSRRSIEELCSVLKPSLIVIDQLDKVKGFDADREDLMLGAVYQWARELAKEYAPVIGVSQASGNGEGIKWLQMGMVANALTAKQAEADWILGIGVDYNDPPNVRGFSICKNKLIGGEESIPGMRHGKWEVLLSPEIGRYEDIKE